MSRIQYVKPMDKRIAYILDKVGEEIKIKDPISGKMKRFIVEGFIERRNEREEPLMVVRYPYSRIFRIFRVDYVKRRNKT